MNFKRINLNSITKLSIKIFIFLIVFLPSGTIGGLNIKILSMAMLIACMLISILSIGRLNKKSLLLIATFAISLIFVIINYITATNSSISKGYATAEGMLFITYFLSAAILLIAITENIIPKNSVIKTIVYSCVFYSTIKIIITAMSVVGLLSIYVVSDFIYQSYGIKPMLFPITDTFSRFQLANDYIVCFALFFMICKYDSFDFIGNKLKLILTYILIISVLISFSRYMILLLFIGLAIRVYSIRKVSLNGILSVLVILSIVIFGYLSNMESINEAISLRFSSDANDVSDQTRSIQIDCLYKAFENRPLLGYGGLGDYSRQCPGPRDAEFSYEVQYLGFLFRFGFLQTIFIALLYFSQFSIAKSGTFVKKGNIPSLIAFLCWMMIGFFNPYLVSGYASVIMVLCVCLTGKKETESDIA
ncbi:O-antigen ligase family protein [Sodalis sp. RH21]|uniref:O-antigen ligase family protein n=1 Tax=unclassified Sodalis (in: enterobacteria) TaxID=2636512 RepID=UPI0039B38B85